MSTTPNNDQLVEEINMLTSEAEALLAEVQEHVAKTEAYLAEAQKDGQAFSETMQATFTALEKVDAEAGAAVDELIVEQIHVLEENEQ